jgi:hypothetical protein
MPGEETTMKKNHPLLIRLDRAESAAASRPGRNWQLVALCYALALTDVKARPQAGGQAVIFSSASNRSKKSSRKFRWAGSA